MDKRLIRVLGGDDRILDIRAIRAVGLSYEPKGEAGTMTLTIEYGWPSDEGYECIRNAVPIDHAFALYRRLIKAVRDYRAEEARTL